MVKTSAMNDETGERRRRVEQGLRPWPTRRFQPAAPCPLADRMDRDDVPGVSIAVIDGSRIDWAGGYGVREASSAEAVTPDTRFQAASISKPVTALAVLRLVQEGRLDLDEDVNAYLRTWRLPANGSWQPRITLRHLLSHTASTTVHGFPGYRRDRPLPTLRQVLDGAPPANTSAIGVNGIPGVTFRYSGGGTCIVQQVLVDVTAMPFPRLMREFVFEPLAMHHSTYEQPLPEHLWPTAATGHRLGGGPVTGSWHVYPEMAAAGLWTTPTDLARVALEIHQARSTGTSHLLSRAIVDEMLTRQFGGPYGLGFYLFGEGATLRFGHGGDNEGFKCSLVAYADQGFGATIMTNGDLGSELGEEILGSIAREYRWPLDPGEQIGTLMPPRDAVALASGPELSYTGRYEVRPGFELRIVTDGGMLTLQPAGQPPLPLIPASDRIFFADVTDIEVSFEHDEAERVSGLTLHQDGETFEARKLEMD